MIPFIPVSFPVSINIGGRKRNGEAENQAKTTKAIPEPASPVPHAVITDADCVLSLNLDQLLMIGVVVSMLILSTTVIIYVARH